MSPALCTPQQTASEPSTRQYPIAASKNFVSEPAICTRLPLCGEEFTPPRRSGSDRHDGGGAIGARVRARPGDRLHERRHRGRGDGPHGDPLGPHGPPGVRGCRRSPRTRSSMTWSGNGASRRHERTTTRSRRSSTASRRTPPTTTGSATPAGRSAARPASSRPRRPRAIRRRSGSRIQATRRPYRHRGRPSPSTATSRPSRRWPPRTTTSTSTSATRSTRTPRSPGVPTASTVAQKWAYVPEEAVGREHADDPRGHRPLQPLGRPRVHQRLLDPRGRTRAV